MTLPGTRRLQRSQITLARTLSKFGVASRKQAVTLIQQGRVGVEGKITRSPEIWVDPKVDEITLDGKRLRRRRPVYLVMNKPVGYITTRSDELGRKTVYDLLPDDTHRLFPVGRLDKDTSGLLLFTNDSRFGEALTNPLAGLPKTYAVEVDKPLRPADWKRMESTFVLKDGTALKPARISPGKNAWSFRMTISEGKNRQIRRVCEELGYQVRHLCRESIGPIRLGTLEAGKTRRLDEKEISSVYSP